MRRIKICVSTATCVVFAFGLSSLFAFEGEGKTTRRARPPSALARYNRGYIYYNPDLLERRGTAEESISIPEEIPQTSLPQVEPPKIIVEEAEPEISPEPEWTQTVTEEIPIEPVKIAPVTEPEAKLAPTLQAEEKAKGVLEEARVAPSPPSEEAAILKTRLASALRELAWARQRIRELEANRPALKTTQTYLVRKGDSLWSIAKKKDIYNDPYKWLLLYHANRDQIYDPNLIFPDMVLLVPRLEEYEHKTK